MLTYVKKVKISTDGALALLLTKTLCHSCTQQKHVSDEQVEIEAVQKNPRARVGIEPTT